MSLPSLKIGELIAKVPIIQGGMGVGVSLSRLASAVANHGGIGVISGVQIGYSEPDFSTNPDQANLRALTKQIRKAKDLSPSGIIGVNLLAAINNYEDMVKTAVKENIDVIVTGAGLPKNLPGLVEDAKTKLAPIVSSGKAASLICKLWDKRYNRVPDIVIVEGPLAGGHLGFKKQQLNSPDCSTLEKLIPETQEALHPFAKKYERTIPVVAAGGIFNGQDIAKFLKMGAQGVQMGTRFVTTEECDVHENFKKAYINSREQDIQLVDSPVGMPGRAISNNFTKQIETKRIPVSKCNNCLKPCDPSTNIYCISEALIKSCQGNTTDGLIFSGTNAYRTNKLTSVKDLMTSLVQEAELAY
ncbi:NAD(P)H-dependent flavin oxidoreductase [Natranaerobius thermophilus]|uniref:Probable nitronate monooxygenase n=1 Tax=Natranaerobius thermophilus (strain ATCC BAA-1301 / DSM 18059 / JW/NM-WN-LF) TaxID=457570 RepID=B2A1K1_NATTJ|nr:nitronate monooxygenase family protein [Natranaerobius thermophilus]ACB84741.1 2-nitropropane dioxygenase NPD [Natranaerobius thermophilus JW/NM-WN-LF]